MRKPVLGKGLRALLGGTPPPGRPIAPPSTPAQRERVSLSPGVGSLLRGTQPLNIVSQRNPRREPSEFTPVQGQRPLVRGLLLAADLVLLTLVSVLVLGRTQPLTLAEWGLCVTALTVGALLAWLAVLEPSGGKLPARDRNDPEPNETPTVSARGHSTLDPRTKS